MYTIKQNTAVTIPFFVHDENGDAVTGLSSGAFTKRISKGSGAFGAMTVTITEMENGWYSIPLTGTHSNTLGLLTVLFTHASSKQINLQWRVESKLVDDLNDLAATAIVSDGNALNTTSGVLDNVTTAGSVTTKTGYSLSSTGADLILKSSTFAAAMADAIWDEVLAGHVDADSAGLVLNEWQDGGRLDLILDIIAADTTTDIPALIAALDSVVDTVKTDTAAILLDTGTDGVVLSAAQMNKIADHVLRRTAANARASSDGDTVAFRSALGAISKLVNKCAIVSTDLISYQEDDTTAFGTQALTTDASAEPITAIDTT